MIGKPYDLDTLRKYGDNGVLRYSPILRTRQCLDERHPSKQSFPHSARSLKKRRADFLSRRFLHRIHRLQIIFDLAHEYGRKVCVLGRSMQKNVEIAEEQGLLKIAHGAYDLDG